MSKRNRVLPKNVGVRPARFVEKLSYLIPAVSGTGKCCSLWENAAVNGLIVRPPRWFGHDGRNRLHAAGQGCEGEGESESVSSHDCSFIRC